MDVAALHEAWWARPNDKTLQVLADAWLETNDPRGLFVQLALRKDRTPEQEKKYRALLKKKGEMVGPARPFLREFEFGPNGLVSRARCEADKLIEGIDEISKLNPGLCLCVTSLKKPQVNAFAKLSLARIHFVTFTGGVIGSFGGTKVNDASLTAIAPAFRGVKNLGLHAEGYGGQCFTPQGLAKFADSLEGLEFFALDHQAWLGREPLPPLKEYVDVVASHAAFKSLKAVFIRGADPVALRTLPNVVTVNTAGRLRFPDSAQMLKELK